MDEVVLRQVCHDVDCNFIEILAIEAYFLLGCIVKIAGDTIGALSESL